MVTSIRDTSPGKINRHIYLQRRRADLPSIFTFHGFRYISVEGMEEFTADRFFACVTHSDIKRQVSLF
ncbi:MAG: family 78 glycoside hydrolase catalytic domain [Blautia obeum]